MGLAGVPTTLREAAVARAAMRRARVGARATDAAAEATLAALLHIAARPPQPTEAGILVVELL